MREPSPFSEKQVRSDPLTFEGLEDAESWEVIKQLRLFPEIIEKSWQQYAPSVIAKYLIDTSQSFNRYYRKTKIISDDTQQNSRLALVHAVGIVLAEGLRLLGMKSPAEM